MDGNRGGSSERSQRKVAQVNHSARIKQNQHPRLVPSSLLILQKSQFLPSALSHRSHSQTKHKSPARGKSSFSDENLSEPSQDSAHPSNQQMINPPLNLPKETSLAQSNRPFQDELLAQKQKRERIVSDPTLKLSSRPLGQNVSLSTDATSHKKSPRKKPELRLIRQSFGDLQPPDCPPPELQAECEQNSKEETGGVLGFFWGSGRCDKDSNLIECLAYLQTLSPDTTLAQLPMLA